MNWIDLQNDRNEQCRERHSLAVERMRNVVSENTVSEKYRIFFQETAVFLLELEHIRNVVADGTWDQFSLSEKQNINRVLYYDILEEQYQTNWANPAFAVERFGEEKGQMLSMFCAEMRSGIPYAFENKMDYLTILFELFVEVYNCFENEEEPQSKEIRDILYWYASDYCDVFLADRVEEQVNPAYSFATDIIEHANLDHDDYLYRFGEYISDNERGTAQYLRTLPEETIQKMADVYTEGYRIGFVNTGKDLSKKSVVNIRYTLGFERVVRAAIQNFRAMGLEPSIYRAASGIVTKREHHKIGYHGAIANMQYEYDHRQDQALFMDKRYIERKLEVMRTAYEKNRTLAAGFAGPALIETFGEKPFAPKNNSAALTYSDAQRELALMFDSRSGQLTNEYIKGEERSFTIIAWPVPEIGEQYQEIFDEVIRINTLDAKLYEQVQQMMIDALDQGDYVHVVGKAPNKTDIRVKLHPLSDPQKETIFENCVADVNIPVGEVFTSPVLEGTEGVLHVSHVYLDGLAYRDLSITFADGKITDYTCANFDTEEENKKYIYENVLQNHETLPLGEFAIGTNTTAYVAARKYGIEDKMPILIAEKTGPHFAVGDTCYSWSEDIRVYNPNGKEIIAKDNSISILRKEDVSKAYLNCHTDITVPYEELEEISVVTKEGKDIILIKDGQFVLPGTEILNVPLKEEQDAKSRNCDGQ